MASYLGTVELGALYKDGVVQSRPTRPWRTDDEPIGGLGIGNIPDFSSLADMTKWNIGNTTSNSATKLKWVKIKDGDKTLLICDRVILVNLTWNNLNSQGYVMGKTITIDGQQYKARLLTGGNEERNTSNSYLGGKPTNNEWDRFITREEGISSLPLPITSDKDTNLNLTDKNSAHNQFWNWVGIYSLCQERHVSYSTYYTVRGQSSVMYYTKTSGSHVTKSVGWRPVLEVLNSVPQISDSDRNLGDKNNGFQVIYQVSDQNNDSLTVKEKLNGSVLRTLNNAPKGQDITLSIDDATLHALPLNSTNTITIESDDGNGGISYRQYTFKRVNSAPQISGADETIGQINMPFTRNYTVTDVENDVVTIKEKIDDIVIRTFNATLGASNTISIPSLEWLKLTNGAHTLKVEATDSKGSTSSRNFNFIKNETKIKMKLKQPFETDARATKIIVTPSWSIGDSTVLIEACNNGLDTNPTWEDITSQVLQNKHYTFTNQAKTASKWGINIRLTVTKKSNNQNEVFIRGFGGAFE